MKNPLQVFRFSIANQTNNSVDIHIDGDIVDATTQEIMKAWFGDSTSVSFKSFRNELNKVDVQIYNIIINSLGGHVGDALAMHDYLRELQNKGKVINTKGIGIVASSATLLLLSGNEPEMTENSFFMMHEVSGGVYGSVTQVEQYAVTMRKFNDMIRDMYTKKTKKPKNKIEDMMNKETWLSATEAKENGFISKITGAVQFNNHLDRDKFPYANTAIINSYNNSVKLPSMKKFWSDLVNSVKDKFKNVKPSVESEDPIVNQTALIKNIGDAVITAFEANAEAFENAVNEAVTARTKALTDQLTEMQTTIDQLEEDVKNTTGKETKDKDLKNRGGKKVIGRFDF